DAVLPVARPARRPSFLILCLGFGSLLAIIALSGWDSVRVLRQFKREDDQIRRHFLARNRLLTDIRSELYLSGTFVRDYLLDPDPARAANFRASLTDVRRRMESELASYANTMELEESRQYSTLRAELAEYWQLLDPVLKWSVEQRQAHGYT